MQVFRDLCVYEQSVHEIEKLSHNHGILFHHQNVWQVLGPEQSEEEEVRKFLYHLTG